MAAPPELIYCAGGNPVMAEIAIRSGFRYGSQLPETVYFQDDPDDAHRLYFADQDWRNPKREQYTGLLEKYRPTMATVLDLERHEQLPEVLEWANLIAEFVEIVIIIPKAMGIIEKLPRRIRHAEVRLGYSVPTGYGGTLVPTVEFLGWPVHLLGGSPQAQMALTGISLVPRPQPFSFFGQTQRLDVRSADGNYHQKMANNRCQFWAPGTARYAKNRFWPTLKESLGKKWGNGGRTDNAHHEAFRRSCENIMMAWSQFNGQDCADCVQ